MYGSIYALRLHETRRGTKWLGVVMVALLLYLSGPIAFELDAHSSGGNSWAKAYLKLLRHHHPSTISLVADKFAMLPAVWGYERIRCNGNGPLLLEEEVCARHTGLAMRDSCGGPFSLKTKRVK